MRLIALSLATLTLLAACGTKGPLTMPPKPAGAPSTQAQPSAPAPTAPADASTGAVK